MIQSTNNNKYYQEIVSNIIGTVMNATVRSTDEPNEQQYTNSYFNEQNQHDDQHHHHDMNDDNMDNGGSFCQASMGGSGMIMYMDGFHFTTREDQPCLNCLFPSWTLDTKFKFWMAVFGTFIFAFCMEGFSKLRHRLVRIAKIKNSKASRNRYRQQQYFPAQQHRPNMDLGIFSTWDPTVVRISITILHGIQALCGYILMLISMTFSVELLLAVVIGLATGYGAFFNYNASSISFAYPDATGRTTTATTSSNINDTNLGDRSSTMNDEETFSIRHVTSTPCCDFMEEEGKEITIPRQQHPIVGGFSDATHPIDDVIDDDDDEGAGFLSASSPCCVGQQNLSTSLQHQQQQQHQRYPNEI